MPIIRLKINDNAESKILKKLQIHNYITNDTGTFGQNQSDFTIELNTNDIGSEWKIDCKYGLVKRYKNQLNENGVIAQDSFNNYDVIMPKLNNNYDFLYTVKGKNRITITVRDMSNTTEESLEKDFLPLEYISFTYTPMYRIGGF